MMARTHEHKAPRLPCAGEGCERSIPNHYWGKVKDGEGWFIARDESQAFCPRHLPDWVPEWRANKARRARRS